MVTIFLLSAQEADLSSQTSGELIEKLLTVLDRDFPTLDDAQREIRVKSMQAAVRTAAHIFEYFCLGALMSGAVRTTGFDGRAALFTVLAVCVLYAASDEVHQLFVEGRSCQWEDVLADSFGSLAGITLVWAGIKLVRKRRSRASGDGLPRRAGRQSGGA